MKKSDRWFYLLVLICLLLANLGIQPAAAAPAAPQVADVVISQVYGGGGNSGAYYKNDFIELYNRGASTVSLSGWSVQYASATGTTWNNKTNLSGSIAPGHYYLIQEAAGSGGSASLPTPDASGSIAMSSTAGKVALVSSTTSLSGACPTGGSIVDFVGFGSTADCYEGGGPTPAPSNTTAVLRKSNGAQDTDDNSVDFAAGAPLPRNSSYSSDMTIDKSGPATALPGAQIVYSLQLSNALPVTATNIVLTDTLPISVTYVSDTSGVTPSHPSAQVYVWNLPNLGANTTRSFNLTVNQVAGLEAGEVLTNTARFSTLLAGDDPANNQDSFSTIIMSAGGTRIHDIQGVGDVSPLNGQTVNDVYGVVTRLWSNGFFMQDPSPDANPLTSEGIFVYTSSAPSVTVGDGVTVDGTVGESYTFTRLTNPTISNAGPVGGLSPTPLALPVTSSLEPYEGMLVTIPETMYVDQNYFLGRYGQLTLSSDGRLFNPTSDNYPVTYEENMRRLLVLDDGSSTENPSTVPYIGADNTVRAGDTITNLTGVIDHGVINSSSGRFYRLQPTQTVTFTRSNARTAAPDTLSGAMRVATFNLYNYFNGNGAGGGFPTSRGASTLTEFNRQRTKLIEALSALDADVVGLMEIERDNAYYGTQVLAIEDLVNGLNAKMGAGTYAYILEPAPGTDAIKVSMIYKPAKVTKVGAAQNYQTNYGGYTSVFSRPPLAQTFTWNASGEKFTVIVNHFKSKSCADASGADLDQGDGQGCYNARRTAQAGALLGFISQLQSSTGDSDIIVLGDLNAYANEDPIDVLTAGGLVNMPATWIAADQRYSYVFDGFAGYLDHLLTSATMAAKSGGATIWHINSDEPNVLDYNTEFNPPEFYSPTPYRSSDHDPLVVSFFAQRVQFSADLYTVGESAGSAWVTATLGASSTTPVTVTYTVAAGTATAGSDFTATTGQLVFSPGQLARSFSVALLGDAIDEADETVLLSLSNPLNASLGTPYTSTLLIQDDDGEPTVYFGSRSYPVDEGVGAVAVDVLLSNAAAYTMTVNYAAVPDTASSSDFTPVSGVLKFSPGQTQKAFNVNILEDALDEMNETVALTLTVTIGATTGTPDAATLTILDNDPAPSVQLSAASYQVGEGDGVATITATLSAASGFPVNVSYATLAGAATADVDFTAAADTLVFEPGETQKAFSIAILEDEIDELAETLDVSLSAPLNATLGAVVSATVTILDNDALPGVQFSAASYEVDEGAGTATVTVTLSAASSFPVSVNYSAAAGTATAGADFTAAAGKLDFAPGETQKTFSVTILEDAFAEASETVNLSLSVPVSVTLGVPAAATLTILDNDVAPSVQFSAATYHVNEKGAAVITVTLSAPSALTVTVNYTMSAGSATSGVDFTPASGVLTFAPGQTSQTITILLVNDVLFEWNETVLLALSTPVNATLGAQHTATVYIVSDDIAIFFPLVRKLLP